MLAVAAFAFAAAAFALAAVVPVIAFVIFALTAIAAPVSAAIASTVWAAAFGAMCTAGSVCSCNRFSSGSKMGCCGGGSITFVSRVGAGEFACAVGCFVGVFNCCCCSELVKVNENELEGGSKAVDSSAGGGDET